MMGQSQSFLQNSTTGVHPAVAGDGQRLFSSKQKLLNLDWYKFEGLARNGGHIPQWVIVEGKERRSQENFSKRLEKPNYEGKIF